MASYISEVEKMIDNAAVMDTPFMRHALNLAESKTVEGLINEVSTEIPYLKEEKHYIHSLMIRVNLVLKRYQKFLEANPSVPPCN